MKNWCVPRDFRSAEALADINWNFCFAPQAFFTEAYMKKNPDHLERIEVLKHLIALQVTLLQICIVFKALHNEQ